MASTSAANARLVPEHYPQPSRRSRLDSMHPAARDALADDLYRTVLVRIGNPGKKDRLLAETIQVATEAFTSLFDRPLAAAEQVAIQIAGIGAREAALGKPFDERFVPSFDLIRSALQAYVPRLLARQCDGAGSAGQLRADLNTFLERLEGLAQRAFDTHSTLTSMDPQHARDRLRRLLFSGAAAAPDLRELYALAARAGLQTHDGLTPVIGLSTPPFAAAREHGLVMVGLAPNEALAYGPASDTESPALTHLPSGTLIIGPCVKLEQVPEALDLTRRAAGLVTHRLVEPRMVIRTSEVLADIVIHADDFAAKLLSEKHCQPLAALSLHRRLDLAELLVRWLESGKPITQLAHEMQCPEQTLYARLQRLRDLFGSTLEDDQQRIELVIALRYALPRWREAVNGSGD